MIRPALTLRFRKGIFMSYCVNCGVELADSERRCPLCMTKVNNPAQPYDPNAEHKYPDVPVNGMRSNHRDLVLPVALFMLIPMFISLVCDFLTATDDLSWSLIVVSSLLLMSVFLLPPMAFAMTRRNAVAYVFVDWAATVLFMLVLDVFTGERGFVSIAVPVSVVAGALILALVFICLYTHIRKLTKSALTLQAAGLCAVATDYIVKLHTGSSRYPIGWSLYVLVPCVILSIIFLVINRNKKLKEDLKQRFSV